MIASHVADRRELFIAALARADIARIDAVFVERGGAIGILRKKDVAVVMKIADEGRGAASVQHAFLDFGNGCRSLRYINGNAHKLRPSVSKLNTLLHS